MSHRIINLCIHGIGSYQRELEPGESRYWIDRDQFFWTLDAAHGRPEVHLSFDDGNKSDIEIGLPLLLKRGLTATFFPIASRLDTPGSLSRADLRELVACGMEIGTHGMNHIPWQGLAPASLHTEIVTAREVIEESAGVEVKHAAMPLGRYDRRVLHGLRMARYARVFSSDRLTCASEDWFQPRYSLTSTDTPDSIWGVLTAPPGSHDVLTRLKVQLKRLR